MEFLAKQVLDFWFGELDENQQCKPEVTQRWFKKDEEFDKIVQKKFSQYLNSAAMGAFDRWSQNLNSCVALIVLLDQFPRNCYRNHAKAFYFDAKALHFSKLITQDKQFNLLPAPYAYFSLMPFMHSESIEDQNLAVSYFEALENKGIHKELFASAAHYARLHRDIILKYGRFPHRNLALDRQSTEEEIEYLKQPGSGF